jgi:hypothetical protein
LSDLIRGLTTSGRGRDDFQAVLVQLFRVEADVIGDDDDLGIGGLARIEAKAACAARDDHADVGVDELVKRQSFIDRGRHLVALHRDLEMNAPR